MLNNLKNHAHNRHLKKWELLQCPTGSFCDTKYIDFVASLILQTHNERQNVITLFATIEK